MDDFFDTLWFKIEALIHYGRSLLDFLFAPLNHLGPAIAISAIAFLTVAITKFLTRKFKTKRYKELKKEFFHWFELRKEAQKCEDPEKARLLTKNIDQARLNKAYYDYFFEGLLNNIATQYLPILLLLAYVNEAYRPGNLLKFFGRDYVFKFGIFDGEPLVIGAVFWFVISIFLSYVGWSLIGKMYSRYLVENKKLMGRPGR